MINPIITRHARTQFRLEHVGPVLVLAIYLFVLVLGFFLSYMIGAYRGTAWEGSLRNYWYGLVAVQIFMLAVVGSLRVAGSVVREREHKRFDFQIVTGMSPWRIGEGEMVGSALFYYFLVLCALPFSLLCVLGGGIDWELFGYSYLIIFTAGFFFHSWALLASSVSRSYASSAAVTMILIALVSVTALFQQNGPDSLRSLSVISPFYLSLSDVKSASDLRQVGFFNTQFPELFAVAVAYVFLGLWALNGAVRKIHNPTAPYISKLQAVVFTAIICVAVSGLLAARSLGGDETWNTLFYANTTVYLTMTLLLLFVFAFILSPSAEVYSKLVRRRIRGVWYTLFGEYSLSMANLLVLFAVSAGIYFGVYVQIAHGAPALIEVAGGKMPLMDISLSFLFVLLAALFYSIVVQLSTFLSKRAGREIAALILLILVILPGLSEIWSGYPETGFLQVFDPVAVLSSILPRETAVAGANLSLAAILFYLAFCTLLGALLFLRLRAVRLTHAPGRKVTPEPAAGSEI